MSGEWRILRPLPQPSADQLERNRQAAAEWAKAAPGPPDEWLALHAANPELAHILWVDVMDEQRAQGSLPPAVEPN